MNPLVINPHDSPTDEVRELASSYALGALPAEEARAYVEHLRNCVVCENEVNAFREVLDGVAEAQAIPPPARLRQRLFDKVESKPPQESEAPRHEALVDLIVRGEDVEWTPVPHATGVYRRRLFVHPATGDETLLVRMDPGGKYPAHPHVGVEQMYILSGELIFEDHTLHAGDFEAATAGHAHASATTNSGCMVLVVHRPLAHA